MPPLRLTKLAAEKKDNSQPIEDDAMDVEQPPVPGRKGIKWAETPQVDESGYGRLESGIIEDMNVDYGLTYFPLVLPVFSPATRCGGGNILTLRLACVLVELPSNQLSVHRRVSHDLNIKPRSNAKSMTAKLEGYNQQLPRSLCCCHYSAHKSRDRVSLQTKALQGRTASFEVICSCIPGREECFDSDCIRHAIYSNREQQG